MFDLQQLIRPNIRALSAYVSARSEYGSAEGCFLDANENPFGEWNRYPDPLQRGLKERLAAVKSVPAENTVIGNGSDELIDLLVRVFCEPGTDAVLTFTPTYGMYDVLARLNGVKLLNAPLNTAFQLDRTATLNMLHEQRPKLVFLCSPNNPTGNCINDAEWLVREWNGIVVVDEAYGDFSGCSLAEKQERYPNLVVLQTLSKAWGLAGARIGIAYASRGIVAVLNKVKPPYNVSAPNQQAAMAALENTALFEERKRLILRERERLIDGLSALSCVRRVFPSDANFLLVEFSDANTIYRQLVARKIIVRNRSGEVPGCLRITVGAPEENTLLLKTLTALNP